MRWTVPLVVVVLVFWTSVPYAADESKPNEIRHSGTIVDVGPNDRMLTMEEIVTWTGPGTGVVKRPVVLTPQTSIDLVKRTHERSPKVLPGWESSPLKPSDLRPGDFITVTTHQRQDRLIAVSVEVVRPASTP
jgi:hypothetical protein